MGAFSEIALEMQDAGFRPVVLNDLVKGVYGDNAIVIGVASENYNHVLTIMVGDKQIVDELILSAVYPAYERLMTTATTLIDDYVVTYVHQDSDDENG